MESSPILANCNHPAKTPCNFLSFLKMSDVVLLESECENDTENVNPNIVSVLLLVYLHCLEYSHSLQALY